MMRRFIFIIFFSIGIAFAGTDGTIRGKVTDADGAPLPGANIYVPVVGVGAAADMEGNYIILNIVIILIMVIKMLLILI